MNAAAHPSGRAPGADEAGHPRRRAILAVVMLGTILGPIDASIVNVILPTITRSFAASVAVAQWIPMAYLLTIASLVLLFGRLGDIWGYRRIFLVGLAGFVTASGLCALAPGIGWLRRARGAVLARQGGAGAAEEVRRERGKGKGKATIALPMPRLSSVSRLTSSVFRLPSPVFPFPSSLFPF